MGEKQNVSNQVLESHYNKVYILFGARAPYDFVKMFMHDMKSSDGIPILVLEFPPSSNVPVH